VSETKSTTHDTSPALEPVARLSTLNRLLPLWIGAAMIAGIVLGRAFPDLNDQLEKVKVDTVSLPIAVGLFAMMFPVLAKVRYRAIGAAVADKRPVIMSLLIVWLIGTALMFTLAWLMLPDLPAYRTGVIIIGLAPCIAMVLIWIDLAGGNREIAAVLVAINQIVAYSLLGWFYLTVLPGWLGLDSQGFEVSIWEVARTVLIFLGIPLLAGFMTRLICVRKRGEKWYEERFLPRISPLALYGLLLTIVLLFAIQGSAITDDPLDVARIALPLLAYFLLMFGVSFWWGYAMKFGYERTATLSLTAASNNFELAIAVAIGVFGATSGEALAGVVGPLIEVPVLVGLVYVSLWLRRRMFSPVTP